MEPKKILILSQNTLMLVPSLERSLKDFNSAMKIKFQDNFTFEEADLIFVDYSLLGQNQQLMTDLMKFPDKLAVLTSLVDHEGMTDILRKMQVHHLFGLSGPNSFSDIRDFILYQFTNVKWDLDTFIKTPIHKTQKILLSSSNMLANIPELLEGHDFSEWFEGIQDYLTQILHESISNALFNAPVDESGAKLFKSMDRKTLIHTIPGKEPVVSVTTDQKKVVLSIEDSYGSISESDIFHYLTQNKVMDKEGGAGVGLYITFKYAHKMIINVNRGVSTRFLIIIEKDKRFKWFMAKEKSFHLFYS